jgi:excisionase family DNA binding protein
VTTPQLRPTKRRTAALGYSVPEAAEAVGVGRNAMYQAIKRGQIEVQRFGRKIIVLKPALHKNFGETV